MSDSSTKMYVSKQIIDPKNLVLKTLFKHLFNV